MDLYFCGECTHGLPLHTSHCFSDVKKTEATPPLSEQWRVFNHQSNTSRQAESPAHTHAIGQSFCEHWKQINLNFISFFFCHHLPYNPIPPLLFLYLTGSLVNPQLSKQLRNYKRTPDVSHDTWQSTGALEVTLLTCNQLASMRDYYVLFIHKDFFA